MKNKKILLIRPAMMGDTILLTAIASSIKEKHKDSEIYMMLQPPFECIIEDNPEISGYFLTKEKLSIKEILSLAKEIKKQKFDYSIVFEDNPSPQFALISLLAGIKNRIGDKSRLLYGWMYNKGIFINSSDGTKHHLELYAELLGPLGIKNPSLKPRIEIDKIAEKNIKNILGLKTSPFICIHIGTGGGNKALTPKMYAQISDAINEKMQCKVFLTGGEKELPTLKEIKTYAKHPFTSLVALLSIKELFAAIKEMDVFVGVDSGPMHAAAALKVPVAAIYTAKDVNPARWFPWITRNIIIKGARNCKLKCSHRDCDKNFCIDEIKTDKIIEAIISLLKGEGNQSKEKTRSEALKND